MPSFEILHRYTAIVLYKSADVSDLRSAVIAAIASGAESQEARELRLREAQRLREPQRRGTPRRRGPQRCEPQRRGTSET